MALVMLNSLFVLLILFQVKHFLADYPLQSEYMLGKFKPGFEFLKPLLSHVAVHGFFTFVISNVFFFKTPGGFKYSIGLALLDMFFHFAIDRIKASPKMLGRFKALTKKDFEEHDLFTAQVYKAYSDGYVNRSEFEKSVRDENLRFSKVKKSNKYFWWSLGLDQMAHHLTHYLIIYFILTLNRSA